MVEVVVGCGWMKCRKTSRRMAEGIQRSSHANRTHASSAEQCRAWWPKLCDQGHGHLVCDWITSIQASLEDSSAPKNRFDLRDLRERTFFPEFTNHSCSYSFLP